MNKNEITSNNSDQSQVDDQNPQGQVPNSTSQADVSTSELSPDELKKLVDSLRKENAKNRKRFQEQELAAQQEAERKMAEQGQYKELLTQKEAEIERLKQVEERYTKLAEKVGAQIKTDTKNWPAEVKAFHPGDEAHIEQIADWYERSKPIVERMEQQQRAAQPGNAPNPRPTGTNDSQQDIVRKLRASHGYGRA